MIKMFARSLFFGDREKRFNFRHSSSRMRIECGFGMLVARFGGLKRQYDIGDDEDHNRFVMTCMRLHNLCIDLGDSKVSREWRNGDDDVVDSDGEELNEDVDPDYVGGYENDAPGKFGMLNARGALMNFMDQLGLLD